MRKLLSLFVVVFVFLVSVMPVQAQGILRGGYIPSSPEGWYYYFRGDQVHMLQADQINWVAETMNISRAQFRRVTNDMMFYNGQFGLRGQRGFYPMYQCSSVGRRWERGIGTMLITTAVGAAVAGKKGAVVGAGVGTGYALYKDSACEPAQNQMVVVDDPSDLRVAPSPGLIPQASGRENGWNSRLRQQQASAAGTYRRGQIGGRPVYNRTGLDILLWVGDSEMAIEVSRGGHAQVPRNPGRLEAETVETAPGGVELRRVALVIPNHDLDGWDIIVPAGR